MPLDLKSFSCKQCGLCCRWPGYVYLTNEDISSLAGVTGLSEEVFIETYTRLSPNRMGLCLVEHDDGACIFLSDQNQCMYYEQRPAQCRNYPSQWHVPEGCPGFEVQGN